MISMVDASGIQSQWQAHFLQIFPIQMDTLPQTHESDRECFKQHWQGIPMSYETFMRLYYKNWKVCDVSHGDRADP